MTFSSCVCRRGMLKPYPCFSDTVPIQLCVTNEGEQVSSNMIKPASYLTSPPLTTPPLSSPPLPSSPLQLLMLQEMPETRKQQLKFWKKPWLPGNRCDSGQVPSLVDPHSSLASLHCIAGMVHCRTKWDSLSTPCFVSRCLYHEISLYVFIPDYVALVPCMQALSWKNGESRGIGKGERLARLIIVCMEKKN